MLTYADKQALNDLAGMIRVSRQVSLLHPIVEKHLALNERVMLHDSSRFGSGTHFKRLHDANGYYVRTAQRGQIKKRLVSCDIIHINDEPTVFQYRTAEE